MIEEINRDRRRFLSIAVTTIASAELGMIGSRRHNRVRPSRRLYLRLNRDEYIVRAIEAD